MRDAPLGCLSRSVGPSRFPLSPLLIPWRQPGDGKLNLAVYSADFASCSSRLVTYFDLISYAVSLFICKKRGHVFLPGSFFDFVEIYSRVPEEEEVTYPTNSWENGRYVVELMGNDFQRLLTFLNIIATILLAAFWVDKTLKLTKKGQRYRILSAVFGGIKAVFGFSGVVEPLEDVAASCPLLPLRGAALWKEEALVFSTQTQIRRVQSPQIHMLGLFNKRAVNLGESILSIPAALTIVAVFSVL